MNLSAAPSISAIILTHNEERNLPHCLEALKDLCQQIFVVDSGSSDRTTSIAQQYGAHVVQHRFETHAKQWNWALRTLPLTGEWVLALDADQRITPGLREEISQALPKAPADADGYYLPRQQVFRGRWIRHGGYWPKYLLKLFRREKASCDERELVDAHFYVGGKTGLLRHSLIEQNAQENQILFWLQKHLRYIELHAREEFLKRTQPPLLPLKPSAFGTPDQQVLWLKRLWYRLPLGIRPFLYFGYRYFLQLGFLDGSQGVVFHFLQGFWLRWMIDLRLQELERERRAPRF